MKEARTLHGLYEVALGQFRDKARELGVSLKEIAKLNDYSGKVLRRGTPGAFGFDLRPRQSAKSDRRGFNAAGNSRDRRFARRHPNHFSNVAKPELEAAA